MATATAIVSVIIATTGNLRDNRIRKRAAQVEELRTRIQDFDEIRRLAYMIRSQFAAGEPVDALAFASVQNACRFHLADPPYLGPIHAGTMSLVIDDVSLRELEVKEELFKLLNTK